MLQPSTRSRYATAQDGVSMSLQKKFDVRNPLSNQSGIVETKRTLAMRCANPPCSRELLYFREGRIELLELESHADEQFRPDDGAFAMNSLPSKYFWLCGECSEIYNLKRWTTSGLVLVLRQRNTAADNHPDLAAPPAIAGTTGPPSSLTSNPGAGSTR
jgi:hypothetical protein